MVYLHAGEFRFGAANDLENAFPYYAKGKVLLVTANARLG
jgi:carboxylesterase type B